MSISTDGFLRALEQGEGDACCLTIIIVIIGYIIVSILFANKEDN